MPDPTSHPDRDPERDGFDLDAAILAWRDGALDDAAFAELQRRLADDPAARDRFVAALYHHHLTARVTRPDSAAPGTAAPDNVDRAVLRASKPHAAAQRGVGVAAQLRGRGPGVAALSSPRNHRRFALAAAVLFAAAAVTVSLVVLLSGPGAGDSGADDERLSVVATLLDTTGGGGLIADDVILSPGAEIRSGEVRLDGGSAEFQLANGVVVHMRGPTRLRIDRDLSASLTRGSAAFVCPAHVTGYTVYLPGGVRVVDLGTAFGLHVADGERLVAVTEGRVRVEVPGAEPRTVDAGFVGISHADGSLTPGLDDDRWQRLFPDDAMLNAALGARTHQSSDHGSKLFESSNAVDGRLDTVTHTAGSFPRPGQQKDLSPSWQVDLGRPVDVYRVVLHNRDQSPARLRDIRVEVLDDAQAVVWASDLINPENALGSPDRIGVDPIAATGAAVRGRFVRVSRVHDADGSGAPDGENSLEDRAVLSLAEVQVLTPHLPPLTDEEKPTGESR